MATKRHFVKIGGSVGDVGEIKYGFVANENAYDGIADELGVTIINENSDAKGVAFGINYPKAPKVRINYVVDGTGSDARTRSTKRFCDPDKIGQVLNGALNDKEINVSNNTYKIRSCSVPG